MSGRLKFSAFGPNNPLTILGTNQSHYLCSYLSQLGARSVVEEPRYFDRDYLAEFSAYYSTSAHSYGNACRRLHFFSAEVKRRHLLAASSGSARAWKSLQDSYLGFVVIRPLPFAPLGRTVLRWYPQPESDPIRITEPARDYVANIAGLPLTVHGLAWQQQDQSVGACATVALWTMLHSSALAHHRAIPTTAEITQLAHKRAGLGARVFPSTGLTYDQISEAVKECGLAPAVCEGDMRDPDGQLAGFSRVRFASSCAAFLRSGYPVLIGGWLEGAGGHAIVAVGFKEASSSSVPSGRVALQDADISFLYVNDDNIGPNARFEIVGGTSEGNPVRLVRSIPPAARDSKFPDPTETHPSFVPHMLVAAVHDGLRVTPDGLHKAGYRLSAAISILLNTYGKVLGTNFPGTTVSTRFLRIADYVGQELGRTLAHKRKVLGRVRLQLQERPQPMSLHVGVVRVGHGSQPLLDVVYDTTNGDAHIAPFGHLAFAPVSSRLLSGAGQMLHTDFGVGIKAY